MADNDKSKEIIVRSVATLRMFIAAHNTVTPMERITGEELELLEDIAIELNDLLTAQKGAGTLQWCR